MQTDNHNFPTQKAIVVLSSIEWDFTWQRNQAITSELADSFEIVVYVESLPRKMPGVSELKRIPRRILAQLKVNTNSKPKHPARENIQIISPVVLPSSNRLFQTINRKIFLPGLGKQILEIAGERPLLINYSPTQSAVDLCRQLKPRGIIYEYNDRVDKDPRTPAINIRSHREMAKMADVITTPSAVLAEDIQNQTGKSVCVLPHGVNFDLYNKIASEPIPQQIKKVGFFGAIRSELDFEIIQKIADRFDVTLLGPVHGEIPPLRNVRLLPPVPYVELPGIMAGYDLLLLPYVNDEYAQGINPIKMMEYFATGKPVIGTPIPAVSEFEDCLMVARSGDEALQKIKEIKTWETAEKRLTRIQIAQKRSWKSVVEKMLNLLEQETPWKG